MAKRVRFAGLAVAAALLTVPGDALAQSGASCAALRLGTSGELTCDSASALGLSQPAEVIDVTFGPGLDIVGDPILSYAGRARRTVPGLRALALQGAPGNLASPLNAFAVSSSFGERYHPILGITRMHNGLDMAAPTGSRVHAAAAGIVTQAGWEGGYGLAVRIRHPGNVETRYGHLSSVLVSPGETVTLGEVIGLVGSTGLSTGPHLHYELRYNGVPTNPRATVRQR